MASYPAQRTRPGTMVLTLVVAIGGVCGFWALIRDPVSAPRTVSSAERMSSHLAEATAKVKAACGSPGDVAWVLDSTDEDKGRYSFVADSSTPDPTGEGRVLRLHASATLESGIQQGSVTHVAMGYCTADWE